MPRARQLHHIRHRGATLRPQLDELETFVALLASLDPRQKATAELADEQEKMLLGPEARNKDWNFPARAQGIPASSLNGEQRALLMKAISLYVNDVADATAATILARYARELDSTYLSFSGSGSLTRTGDYVRIDGPSVWLELVMDPPYSTNQPHTHAAWRDKRTDYGGTRGLATVSRLSSLPANSRANRLLRQHVVERNTVTQ